MKTVICAAGIFCLLVFFATQHRPPAFPPLSALHEVRHSAFEDMAAVSLGARRLFADLWFVRLMQYYGTPEICEEEQENAGHAQCHHGPDFGTGQYSEFLALSLHIATLDPYFKNAVLYSAGSLAFNMNPTHEAVALLNYALINTPKDWKLLKILAAIGYGKAYGVSGGNPLKIASELAPLVREADCPVMLKQQAAFLNKKGGNYSEAAAIYADILRTTKDPFYIANAERELKRLASARAR